MARQKQLRFAALQHMPNVIDGTGSPAGWFDHTCGATTPVVVELGCGRGEYTLALARRSPGQMFLGVDRNGARLWNGARTALDAGLTNAFFLRLPIEQLADHVPRGRIAELWIPFPDPLPKRRQSQHRLVSPEFLRQYRALLTRGGSIRLKTDDARLIAFAEHAVRTVGGQLITASDHRPTDHDEEAIQTAYERKYRRQGRTIYERQFVLAPALAAGVAL